MPSSIDEGIGWVKCGDARPTEEVKLLAGRSSSVIVEDCRGLKPWAKCRSRPRQAAGARALPRATAFQPPFPHRPAAAAHRPAAAAATAQTRPPAAPTPASNRWGGFPALPCPALWGLPADAARKTAPPLDPNLQQKQQHRWHEYLGHTPQQALTSAQKYAVASA